MVSRCTINASTPTVAPLQGPRHRAPCSDRGPGMPWALLSFPGQIQGRHIKGTVASPWRSWSMKQPIYSNNDMSKLFKTDIKGGSKWFQGLRRHFRQVRLGDSLLNVKQGGRNASTISFCQSFTRCLVLNWRLSDSFVSPLCQARHETSKVVCASARREMSFGAFLSEDSWDINGYHGVIARDHRWGFRRANQRRLAKRLWGSLSCQDPAASNEWAIPANKGDIRRQEEHSAIFHLLRVLQTSWVAYSCTTQITFLYNCSCLWKNNLLLALPRAKPSVQTTATWTKNRGGHLIPSTNAKRCSLILCYIMLITVYAYMSNLANSRFTKRTSTILGRSNRLLRVWTKIMDDNIRVSLLKGKRCMYVHRYDIIFAGKHRYFGRSHRPHVHYCIFL